MNEELQSLIRTTPELAAACDSAKTGGIASLDTEFVWVCTCRPRLGLIQMADAAGNCRALDCLRIGSADPLADVIRDPAVVKILHDAHQDLGLIGHYTGAAPVNVFDTQLAAGFCGYPSNLGLQKLLMEILDIGLAKTETRTDWCRRPLSEAQVRYALDDVRYLAPLRDALLAKCDACGTRAWLDEELLRYETSEGYGDIDPMDAWKKVKPGVLRHLGRRDFVFLRALAATRETLARELDQPRAWVGDDASLADLARRGPAPAHELRFRHRLSNPLRGRVAAAYAATLSAAAALPEEEWPEPPVPYYIREVLDAADQALEFLKERGEALHVDPAVFANRATLTAYIDNPDMLDNPLGTGWRYEVVGREIAERFYVP